jgi:basic membrane protein A
VKVSRWMLVAGTAAIVVAVAVAGSIGVAKAPAAALAAFKTALVLDTGGPNDNGFNANQVVGLNKATAQIHGTKELLLSNSNSDYSPNYQTAISNNANLIIAAGFLLGSTVQQYAQNNPGTKFAITDDPAAAVGGYANEMGITYRSNQAGCLAGVLAAKEAQFRGHKVIGAVGGIQIPPVDIWIAGYQFCAAKAVPGTKVLVQYSGNFTNEADCAALAQNEMGQNAQVIFQVAGGCGVGALKYAGNHGAWGVGVDSEESGDAPNVLTSALKKTDVGVETVILKAFNHKWNGGHNVKLSLANNGVGIGKIDASVPKAWINLMNQYKNQILNGSLKPPVKCPNNQCGT